MPARAHSGPAPDPNALRRDRASDAATWTTLPREGRLGPPPKWPLTRQSARERVLWKRFWAKPQAIVWERDDMIEVVGTFVREFAEGERPDAPAATRNSVRLKFTELYLTSDSLARARLRIGDVEPEAETSATVTDLKGRLVRGAS